MLLGNVTLLHKMPVTFLGGATLSCETVNFTGNEKSVGHYAAEVAFDAKAAVPNGYTPGYAWVPARVDGGMSSYTQAAGLLSPQATMAAGRNLEGTAALELLVASATLDQVVPLAASAALSLTGTGALAAAVAMTANANLALAGSATLGGVFDIEAQGTFQLSPGVTLTALAHLEGSAGGPTPLSPEGLTAQLLDNSDIETGFSLRQALRLILASVAGKLSGAGTATITIRNVPDSKDRIVATVDANGNRTSVTYDVGE